jgi:hypothetical protein
MYYKLSVGNFGAVVVLVVFLLVRCAVLHVKSGKRVWDFCSPCFFLGYRRFIGNVCGNVVW